MSHTKENEPAKLITSIKYPGWYYYYKQIKNEAKKKQQNKQTNREE